MKYRKVIIKLETGLHDLNAARFVQQVSELSSDIQIEYDNMILNAKSLMGVLCMDLAPGTEVMLTADGADEEKALDCLEAFLNRSKHEDM